MQIRRVSAAGALPDAMTVKAYTMNRQFMATPFGQMASGHGPTSFSRRNSGRAGPGSTGSSQKTDRNVR